MPYTYTCPQCHKSFTATKRGRIYCSRSCRSRARRALSARQCLNCDQAFLPERSEHVYCSTECYHKAARTGGDLVCAHCGKAIYRTAARLHRGERFCSQACRRAATPRVEKDCSVCGKTFQVLASVADRYTVCSRECRRRDTPRLTCARCGAPFTGERGRVRRYCSEECRRPPHHIECATCGKTFRTLPGDTDRRFCSFACYRRSQAETSIERRVREVLDAMGLLFEQEHHVGRYSIDFYLPAYRVAIEVDGSYWHQDPMRDARKDAHLTKRGITVVRISEDEVNSGNVVGVLSAKLAPHLTHRVAPALL